MEILFTKSHFVATVSVGTEGEASGQRFVFSPVASEMSTTYKRPAFWRVPDYIHDEEIFERYAGGRRKSSIISSTSRRNSVKKHVHFKDDPPTVNSTQTATVPVSVPASKVSHWKHIVTYIKIYLFSGFALLLHNPNPCVYLLRVQKPPQPQKFHNKSSGSVNQKAKDPTSIYLYVYLRIIYIHIYICIYLNILSCLSAFAVLCFVFLSTKIRLVIFFTKYLNLKSAKTLIISNNRKLDI